MAWSPEQVELILERMRAGATVRQGNTRCHQTYYFRAGAWGYEEFDEGSGSRGTTSEASIRSLIERSPELFEAIVAQAE